MSRLRRRVRDIVRRLRVAIGPAREIARLERLAEAAYTAMYDAPRTSVRDCHDAAQGYLTQAIKIAERASMADVAARLKRRKDEIYNVYDHQFR